MIHINKNTSLVRGKIMIPGGKQGKDDKLLIVRDIQIICISDQSNRSGRCPEHEEKHFWVPRGGEEGQEKGKGGMGYFPLPHHDLTPNYQVPLRSTCFFPKSHTCKKRGKGDFESSGTKDGGLVLCINTVSPVAYNLPSTAKNGKSTRMTHYVGYS